MASYFDEHNVNDNRSEGGSEANNLLSVARILLQSGYFLEVI